MGALLELLRWWKLRENINLPAYSRRPFYWAVTIAMVLGGGVPAVLYGFDEPRSALMVMNDGASAPALIGVLAAPGTTSSGEAERRSEERRAPSTVQDDQGIRKFLAFSG